MWNGRLGAFVLADKDVASRQLQLQQRGAEDSDVDRQAASAVRWGENRVDSGS